MTTDYENVCAKIKRWRSRLKRAVNMIEKLERQKARMERKVQASKPTSPPAFQGNKPTLTESCNHIVSAIIQGQTFEQTSTVEVAKHDLDIPGFLKRTPQDIETAEKIKAENEERRKAKATARALKVKGQVAERKSHDSIPKSKRRWDTSNSRWIEA